VNLLSYPDFTFFYLTPWQLLAMLSALLGGACGTRTRFGTKRLQAHPASGLLPVAFNYSLAIRGVEPRVNRRSSSHAAPKLMEVVVPLRESGRLHGLPFPTLSESNRQHNGASLTW